MSIRVYTCKDGRVRAYNTETQKVTSYPRYLMETELGRPLLPEEEVHHKDENPMNNELSNLEVRLHGEHQAEHSTKYRDTIAICGWCGKEFLWTGVQQRRFYSNRRNHVHNSEMPFCSRQCSGHYGRKIQGDYKNPRRRLNDEQAKYIREHYIPYDENFGASALARRFGVVKRVIDGIVSGETYRDCY